MVPDNSVVFCEQGQLLLRATGTQIDSIRRRIVDFEWVNVNGNLCGHMALQR